MARALLLACGNTLRGDDGVGWWIGGQVEQNLAPADLEVVLTHQFLPEFADIISKAEIVVFVDCSAVTQPGAVSVFPVEAAAELPRIMTHQMDPASLLRMAADYVRAPAEHRGRGYRWRAQVRAGGRAERRGRRQQSRRQSKRWNRSFRHSTRTPAISTESVQDLVLPRLSKADFSRTAMDGSIRQAMSCSRWR